MKAVLARRQVVVAHFGYIAQRHPIGIIAFQKDRVAVLFRVREVVEGKAELQKTVSRWQHDRTQAAQAMRPRDEGVSAWPKKGNLRQ